MRRWIGLVAGFYPRGWRDEFGLEFDALLEDVRPSWRVFRNVLGGAIRMQISDGGNWMKVVGAMAVIGALVAFAFSFRVAPDYVSSAVMSVTPQVDPVRSTSAEALHEPAARLVTRMEQEVLTRASLASVINDPRLDLYPEERRRMPVEDVIQLMRSNIHIQQLPSTGGDMAPIVFDVSFSYPDQAKAQATVRELASVFSIRNENDNRFASNAYEGFWSDMTEMQLVKSVPAPPVGETFSILSRASSPVESGPNRTVFLAWGLAAGLVLGLLAAFALQRQRGIWRVCGWALTGVVVGFGLAYLIPGRYTSSATMEIAPSAITEDPRAPLPAATPAAEFLRQLAPEILSVENLSAIIQDRGLDLYADERTKISMEEVARKMAGDLSIVPVNSTFETSRPTSAFQISFTYRDRYKAQKTVWALMNSFENRQLEQQKANAIARGPMAVMITERKAGPGLWVLDPASLPVVPVSRNRLAIVIGGLCLGLLIGMLRLRGQGRVAAIPQMA